MLLLQPVSPGGIDEGWLEPDEVRLWDDSGVEIAAGRNYAGTEDVDF